MSDQRTKTPIKNLPVRQPGQSSRENVGKIFDDEFMPYFFGSLVFGVIAMFEWYRYFTKAPPHPALFSVMFAVVLALTIRRGVTVKRRIRQVKLGEQGEQSVGQALDEKLRPLGCQVFHDILADGFNVDH